MAADLADGGDGRAVIATRRRPLVIGCGALASELRAVLVAGGLDAAVEVRYLPPTCTTGRSGSCPALEEALADDDRARGVHRLRRLRHRRGARPLRRRTPEHRRGCPAPTATSSSPAPSVFAALHDAEPGTFYLTDFLAKHFDPLVWQGLGLDRHPELRDAYFGNYRRLVLLSQSEDPRSRRGRPGRR